MLKVAFISPRSLCLTVVGRERGAGTSSTQIVVRAETKVKPSIEAFKNRPKGHGNFRSPLTGVDLIVHMYQ